jgi:hypothetical protein
MDLVLLHETFAICKLPVDSPIPEWALAGPFVCITRTSDELSLVCLQDSVPDMVMCQRDWRCLRVDGILDFSQAGILASFATPLAEAGISVFAISTYNTDYLLMPNQTLQRSVEVLRRASHSVQSGA